MSYRSIGGSSQRLGRSRAPMRGERNASASPKLVAPASPVPFLSRGAVHALSLSEQSSGAHGAHERELPSPSFTRSHTMRSAVHRAGQGRAGQRIIGHAPRHLLRYRLPVVPHEERLSLPKVPFESEAIGQRREGSGNLGQLPTAEFLFQGKHAEIVHHGAMTDRRA